MPDNNKPSTPKQTLLGELESIKDLLNDNEIGEFDESLSDELLDIPILDDVVPELSNNTQASGLLDLDNIFDDINDEHLANQLIENHSDLGDTALSTTSFHPNQSNTEWVKEPEASLKIDHLDANVSFPSFTLDTTIEQSIESHHDLDAIPILEANTIDNRPLQAESALPPISHGLQQALTKSFSDTVNLQKQQPLLDNPIDDLDLMIQELVDEFIPPIEAELRKRLSKCSPAVIVELAKKHLDN